MSFLLDRHVAIDALKALDRLDQKRKICGSQAHDYRLNPPVPEAVISAFENKIGSACLKTTAIS